MPETARPFRGLERIAASPEGDSPNRVVERCRPAAACFRDQTAFAGAIPADGREVRRLADNRALLRLAQTDQIADDDVARGDADPACQRGGAALQPAHTVNQCQTGPYRLLGIVFMRLGIAK
jgi:hypothetical protein